MFSALLSLPGSMSRCHGLVPASRIGKSGYPCRAYRAVTAILCAVIVTWILTASHVVQGEDPRDQRPQDEIWLVSARYVGCVHSGDVPNLEAQQYQTETGWSTADVSELSQPMSPDQITLIYVHGNRVATGQAAYEGRYVYRLLTARFDDPTPIRYVIWSWPSEQIKGQLRDVRVKAQRTEVGGYCFGWFLSQLPEQQRVSVLSYSFGARIATGGLHLLGGGRLGRRVLPPYEGSGPTARVVMLAGAVHTSWLRPGCYHEMALSHTDYLLNLFNSCDPVLKRYRFLDKRAHSEALGFTGMYTGDLGEKGCRIEQWDACNSVRKSHAAIHYFENRFFRDRMDDVLFWRPLDRAPAAH